MSLTPKPQSSPLLKILSTAVIAGSVATIGCEDLQDSGAFAADATQGSDDEFSVDAAVVAPDGGAVPPMPPPQGDAGPVIPSLDGGAIPPMPPPQGDGGLIIQKPDAGAIPPMPPPQGDGGFVIPTLDGGAIPPMPPPMPNPFPGDF